MGTYGDTLGETLDEGLGLHDALEEGETEAEGERLAEGETGRAVTSMEEQTFMPLVASVRLKVWTQNSKMPGSKTGHANFARFCPSGEGRIGVNTCSPSGPPVGVYLTLVFIYLTHLLRFGTMSSP